MDQLLQKFTEIGRYKVIESTESIRFPPEIPHFNKEWKEILTMARETNFIPQDGNEAALKKQLKENGFITQDGYLYTRQKS